MILNWNKLPIHLRKWLLLTMTKRNSKLGKVFSHLSLIRWVLEKKSRQRNTRESSVRVEIMRNSSQ